MASSNDVNTFDAQKYKVVFDGLNTRKPTVGWDASLHSLEQASHSLFRTETQDFLNSCLLSMVNIFLDQRPGMVALENRQKMERALHYANVIALADLAEEKESRLRVIAELANPTRNYYQSATNPAYSRPGLSGIRSALLYDFFMHDGFKYIAALFVKHHENGRIEPWLLGKDGDGLGGASLCYLLMGLCDSLLQQASASAGYTIDPAYINVVQIVVDKLPGLSESLVKTDGVDVLTELISVLHRLHEVMGGEDGDMLAFSYWTKLILHYLKSSSLPLRLVACEHMENIVTIAEDALPPAQQYLIYGAGNEEVNGLFGLSTVTHAHGAMWTKVDDVTGSTLTLFQCGIQNSSKKWWYLSEADPYSPGTDKDVDYYKNTDAGQRHKRHPPLRGWIVCDGRKERGVEPAPMIKFAGPLNWPEDSKASVLVKCALASNALEVVFGDSMHREVVARSSYLLIFLAKASALKIEHLDLIWKACLKCGEAELCDEILAVLASLCTYVNSDVLIQFLNIATESTMNEETGGLVKMGVKDSFRRNSRALPSGNGNINSASSGNNSSTSMQGQYSGAGSGMAMKLANKLADMKFLRSLPQPFEPKLLDALLGLVWGLVSLPPDLWRLNKQSSGLVHTMAQELLQTYCIDDSHHMKALTDCLSILRISASTTSVSLTGNKSSRTSTSNASTGRQSPMNNSPGFEEDDILHTCSLACLVLENFPSPTLRQCAIDKLASEFGLTELLSEEISSWRKRRSSHFPIGQSAQRSMPPISSNSALASPAPPSTILPSNESPRVVTLAGAMSASSLSKSSKSKSYSTSAMANGHIGTNNVSKISTLSSELGARLDLWACVYSASPQVSLEVQQLSDLWKILQLPEEKERCLLFFHNALKSFNLLRSQDMDSETMFPCFSEYEIVFIDSELLAAGTDWTYLGEDSYHCLRAFQSTVMYLKLAADRMNEDDDMYNHTFFDVNSDCDLWNHIVKTDDEKCLDVIWSVFLRCKDSTVASMAMLDLISIHNNMSFPDKLQAMQSRLLNRTIGYLEQSYVDLDEVDEYMLNIGRGQTGVGDVDLCAVRLRIKRCIMILKSSISKSYASMPLPHTLKSSANQILISVTGRKMESGNGQQQRSHVMNLQHFMSRPVNFEPFQLHVHPLESIRSIRLKIRDIVASNYPINGIYLVYMGKVLNDDELLVRDINFLSSGKLNVTAQENPYPSTSHLHSTLVTTELMLVPPVEGMKHLGEVIRGEDSFYIALFNLLKHSKLDDPIHVSSVLEPSSTSSFLMELPTSTAIWEFLSTLPTQKRAEAAVLTTNKDESSSDSWSRMFADSDNWHHQVYLLQICDFCLSPVLSNGFSFVDEPYTKMQSQEFKCRFVRNGGLTQVLEFFMQPNLGARVGTQHVLIDMAAMIALRLLNECIFKDHDSNQGLLTVDKISPLLERLVCILLQSHENTNRLNTVAFETKNDINVTINKCLGVNELIEHALLMVTELVKQGQEVALEFFKSSSATKDVVVNLLVLSKSSRVRNSMKLLCLGCLIPFAKDISSWLVEQLNRLQPDCSTCDELFNVLGFFVRKNIPQLNLEEIAHVVVAKLMEIRRFSLALSHKVLQSSSSMSDDDNEDLDDGKSGSGNIIATMLSGCLILLSDIMNLNASLSLQGTELEHSLIHVMIHEFLFTLPEKHEPTQRQPVCFNGGNLAIKSALKLIQVSCQHKHQDLLKVMEELDTFAQVCKSQLARRWQVECSSDLKAKGIRFTGLLNQGCTCYMNSTLQQLFMIEPLRKAIIEATMEYEKFIDGEKFTPAEVCGREISIECFASSEDKDCEKRETVWRRARVYHWNELEDCHTVCFEDTTSTSDPTLCAPVYFNVFKGRPGMETGKFFVNRSVDAKIAPTKPLKSDDATRSACHILEQVQRTFMHLERTEKKCVNCRPLVVASNCMQLEFNVFQQNDAPEFYDKLMHKLEDALKLTDKFADYERCFGMQVVNQSIPKEQTDRFKPREKADTIMKVELKVQGVDSVEESLSDFVKDELMDGDNKIEFENEAKETEKLTGIRRTCLSQLPNVLVLHLKRFDLDFNTFQTVKLNNRCSFPARLNMKPYTKVGMEERDAEIRKADMEAMEEQTSQPTGSVLGSPQRIRQQEGSSAMSPGRSPLSFSEPITPMEEKDSEDEDFLYELRGVLVHAGGSQSGHYYSFARDSSTGDWYKFDDEDVTLWDPAEMEKECFGGTIQVSRGNGSTTTRDLSANALMVFYDKVVPNKMIPKSDSNEGSDVASTCESTISDDSEGEDIRKRTKKESLETQDTIVKRKESRDVILMSGIEAYADEVFESNLKFRRLGYMFNKHLHGFLKDLLSGVISVDQQSIQSWPSVARSNDLSLGSQPSVSTLAVKCLSDTQLQVIQFCISFFLDIILHSDERDREASNNWVSVISDVFAAHPYAAAVFLDSLVFDEAKHESWLKDYMLLCTDYFARYAFVSIVAAAVKAVAVSEEEALMEEIQKVHEFHEKNDQKIDQQLQNKEIDPNNPNDEFGDVEVSITMSSITDENGNEIGESNYRSSSICVDFIRCMIAFLSPQAQMVSAANFRSGDELMLLFRKMADCHPLVRQCLVSHNVIAKLVYLICDNSAPTIARVIGDSYNKFSFDEQNRLTFNNPFEYHTTFNNMNVKVRKLESVADPVPAVEAIAALINVPQVSKVPLLTSVKTCDQQTSDGPSDVFSEMAMDNWFDQRLTEEAQFVFSAIFSTFSNNKKTLDIRELAHYFKECGKLATSNPKAFLEGIMLKYGQLSTQKMNLEGFLAYYKQMSLNNPKEVWSHLAALSYRNDLSHPNPAYCVSRLRENKQQGTVDDSLDTETSRNGDVRLPVASSLCLTCYSFLDVVLNDTELLRDLLHKLCFRNEHVSLMVISAVLRELPTSNSTSEWANKSLLTQVVQILKLILNIDDDLKSYRIETIFVGTRISLNIAGAGMRERLLEAHSMMAMSQMQSAKFVLNRYVAVIKAMFKHPLVSPFMNQEHIKPSWSWVLEDLQHVEQQQIAPPPPPQTTVGMYPLTIEVKNAGVDVLNGVYTKRSGWVDGSPAWSNELFMIYRCCLESKSHAWFISLVPDGEEPGTEDDTDFYSVPSRYQDNTEIVPCEPEPPAVGWSCLKAGAEPLPELTFFDYSENLSDSMSVEGARTGDEESLDDWSDEADLA